MDHKVLGVDTAPTKTYKIIDIEFEDFKVNLSLEKNNYEILVTYKGESINLSSKDQYLNQIITKIKEEFLNKCE